jgi:hypothetical protein
MLAAAAVMGATSCGGKEDAEETTENTHEPIESTYSVVFTTDFTKVGSNIIMLLNPNFFFSDGKKEYEGELLYNYHPITTG